MCFPYVRSTSWLEPYLLCFDAGRVHKIWRSVVKLRSRRPHIRIAQRATAANATASRRGYRVLRNDGRGRAAHGLGARRSLVWLGGVRLGGAPARRWGTRGTPRGLSHDSRARRRHRAQDAGLRSRCWRNSPRDWPRRTNGAAGPVRGGVAPRTMSAFEASKSFRLIRRDRSATPAFRRTFRRTRRRSNARRCLWRRVLESPDAALWSKVRDTVNATVDETIFYRLVNKLSVATADTLGDDLPRWSRSG